MKKGVLFLIISLVLFIFPTYSYSYGNSSLYGNSSVYSDMSEEEFDDLIDNFSEEDMMEFLDSLDDDELEYLLDEAGMTKDEFNELMDEYYEYSDYVYGNGGTYFDWGDSDEEEDDDEDDEYDYYDDDEYGYDYDGWDQYDGNAYYPETEDEDFIEKPTKKDNNSKDKGNNNKKVNVLPVSIGEKVLEAAREYTKLDTQYVVGGQDMSRSIQIDCSGLVINCYKEALMGTNYSLPFKDTTAYNLYVKYSDPTGDPKPGDLIFMSYSSWGNIDHVGIFECFKGDDVYFIDATLNKYNKNGKSVNRRSYPINDNRVISYGKMRLIEK